MLIKIDPRIKILLSILLIILAGFVTNIWVAGSNNFFYMDDWGWLLYSKSHSWLSYLRLFPVQMYNDRPVGQLFIKILYSTFGLDYIAHHRALLILHIVNAIMLYFFALSLPIFKHKKLSGALLSALFFVGWQGANFAVQWDSAIFDLLGFTFTILFLITVNQYIRSGKSVFLVLSCLLYFVALRTKESALFLPFIAIGLAVLIYKKPLRFLTRFIPLVLICTLYIAILLVLAVNTNFMGLNSTAAYKSSFSPLIAARNIFRYFILYFDITNVYQTYQRNLFLTVCLAIACLVYAYFLLKKWQNDIPVVVFFLGSAVLCLMPVLPLVYSQLRLYLYTASMFFSLFIAFIAYRYIDVRYVGIFICLLVMFYVNLLNKGTLDTRSYWLTTGHENRVAFNHLRKLAIPTDIKQIAITNVKKPTNIFKFYDGEVLRLLYGRAVDIKVYPDQTQENKSTYVIDYRTLYDDAK